MSERASLSHVRAGLSGALDMIFPPHGFDDTDMARLGIGLGADTWSAIRFLDGEGCDMCARPFENGLHFGAGALCEPCTAKPFPFRRTRAACLYGDASRDIILRFKRADRLDLAPMLVRWLERTAADLLADAEVVVPVPLHPLRLLQRRYNQAAELARPLARHAGKTCLPDGLLRTRMTPRQGASADARWANVRGAFAVAKAAAKRIAGRKVVLVDDVFTTGATVRACTEALLSAGAASVDVAVLARVSGAI
ncbi:MAG: ComF family protein [Asticcacaulis sp.]